MCNISEGVVEKTWRRGIETGERRGEERGRKIGKEHGVKRGKERERINSIASLMKNMSLTFDQAVSVLDIPENEREEYRTLVDKSV